MSENPDCDEEKCDGTWNGGCDYICWCGFCPRGLSEIPLSRDESLKRREALHEEKTIHDRARELILPHFKNKKDFEKEGKV